MYSKGNTVNNYKWNITFKSVNHYVEHLKHIILYINYISLKTIITKYYNSNLMPLCSARHRKKFWIMPIYPVGEGNGTPLQYSCLENPMDGGAWWATVHGVTKSRTWQSNFTFTFHFHALEKEMATHSCSCLENPRDGGAWWAAIYGVAQSRT